MKCGDRVFLCRLLRTPVGWFARGSEVMVLVDDGGTVLVCLDLGHHPGAYCHTARVLRKDITERQDKTWVVPTRSHSKTQHRAY